MKSLFKLTILTILFSFFIITAHAQVPSSIDGVDISTSPDNPNPGQTVTVNIESYVSDLNSASIIWLIDGKSYSKGVGQKSISFPAPAIGKSLQVTADILTSEGREIKKAVTVKSGSVDLVWESAGYIPPFYKGKAILAYENPIKITAIPHLSSGNGAEMDPRTLLYKWKKNDKVVQNQSGYGMQTLSIKDDIPGTISVNVEVSTKDGSQKGDAALTLEPGNPSISFYEDNPLYGVLYNKAIVDKISLVNKEVTIRAVPFTFNTNPKNSPLTYLWSINNLERQDLSTNQSITLRTKGDTEGTSNISLDVRNADDILQGAQNAVNVIFSKATAGNSASVVTFQ